MSQTGRRQTQHCSISVTVIMVGWKLLFQLWFKNCTVLPKLLARQVWYESSSCLQTTQKNVSQQMLSLLLLYIPPMVLSWYSWNCPLTKRSTKLDLPTADSPRSTSLNWQMCGCAFAAPFARCCCWLAGARAAICHTHTHTHSVQVLAHHFCIYTVIRLNSTVVS